MDGYRDTRRKENRFGSVDFEQSSCLITRFPDAPVVKLADTQDSGSCAGNGVEVRILSGAPLLTGSSPKTGLGFISTRMVELAIAGRRDAHPFAELLNKIALVTEAGFVSDIGAAHVALFEQSLCLLHSELMNML